MQRFELLTLCNRDLFRHDDLPLLMPKWACIEKSSLFRSEVVIEGKGSLYELRHKVYLFLVDRKHELAAKLTDSDWIVKLLYLSCIFQKLNGLNLSLQGKLMNILTVNIKIGAFKRKLQHWTALFKSKKIRMFLTLE